MSTPSFNTIEYCRTFVARDDPDRYLASLFAPRRLYAPLWALLAFNQDIAQIHEQVREPTLALMRLQWWRETLDKLYQGEGVSGHPVAESLHAHVMSHGLSRLEFDALIDARELDGRGTTPETTSGLESYADFTTTPLLMLMAALHEGDVPRERVRYLGTAYAMTGILRAIPYMAGQGRCLLPQDDMTRAGLTVATLHQENNRVARAKIVRDLAELAHDHLQRATEIDHIKMFKAQKTLTQLYLQQLRVVEYNVFSPRLQHPPIMRELRVWFKTLV